MLGGLRKVSEADSFGLALLRNQLRVSFGDLNHRSRHPDKYGCSLTGASMLRMRCLALLQTDT